MKFTVADLIEQLPHQEPLSLSKLEKGLGLSTKADKEQLRIALTALTRVGVLEEADDGISRVEDEGLIEARLRCSSKGFCFALREDGGEDIYIRDNQLNHAWNGDRVLVRVTREGGRRRSPEGGVQCILQRNTTSLLAQVEQQNDTPPLVCGCDPGERLRLPGALHRFQQPGALHLRHLRPPRSPVVLPALATALSPALVAVSPRGDS